MSWGWSPLQRGDNVRSKQNFPINQLMCSHSTRILLHVFIILSTRSADRRTKDRASSREAAFLLVMFCCDRHSNTKCPEQIGYTFCDQSADPLYLFLNAFVNSPTRPVLLSEAWTGSGDDPRPHYQSLCTCSVMKIQRFIHKIL